MKYVVALALLAACAVALPPPGQEVTVIKSEQDIKEDGSFSYGSELSDGTKTEARGSVKNPNEPDPEKRIHVIEGSYTVIDKDTNTPITVTYVADENGFQPSGAHLPVAPPVPDHVVKLLQSINARARRASPQ